MGHARSARLTFVLIARVPFDGVASFQAYEEAVLPLLSEFGGLLERRLRNSDGTIEVHIVSFDSDQNFQRFRSDPRARLRHRSGTSRCFTLRAVNGSSPAVLHAHKAVERFKWLYPVPSGGRENSRRSMNP
jgi:hypothetical protein